MSAPDPDDAPMRVGVVTQGYITGGGGVRTVARWLTQSLEDRGFDVVVFDLASSSVDTRSRRLSRPGTWGMGLATADPHNRALWRVGANAVELEVCRYLPRSELTEQLNRMDVIQVVAGGPALAYAVQTERPLFLQMATFVRWERAAVLAASRGGRRLWTRTMTAVVAKLEDAALRRAQLVFVENDVALGELRRRGIRSIVAAPGVDTEHFVPNPAGWARDGYLISVGRLGDPRKGYDRMIRALADLRLRLPNCPRLILAGSGELPERIRQLIDALALGDLVSVLPDVPPEALVPLLQGASVFWIASHEEGLGMAVLEAMACGLPVVASRTAGTTTSVTPECGVLVEQVEDFAVQMSQATLAILANPAGLPTSARARAVEFFSTDVAVGPFVNAYRTALQRQSAEHGAARAWDHPLP